MIYKSILVTGGCGFIASNFINFAVKKYPDTLFVNLDAMYYCASTNNIDVSNERNYKFIKGNINSVDLVTHLLNNYNIDCVMHFAAQSHVDNSFSGPLQYTKDNVLGTHNLLECCRKYNKLKLFIHVSTDEVYGESHLDDNRKNEASLLCPTNPYAASKAGAEIMASSYHHSYGMPIIITRGNNVYGERQYPEKLIPKFICLLKKNKKVTIHGEGKTMRAFLHVSDVVNAFDTVLEQGKIGEIYNIGSDDEYTVNQIAKILINKIKKTNNINDWTINVEDRMFNDKRYYICSQKLNNLGWTPKVNFDDGINNCIDWYCNQINDSTHWT